MLGSLRDLSWLLLMHYLSLKLNVALEWWLRNQTFCHNIFFFFKFFLRRRLPYLSRFQLFYVLVFPRTCTLTYIFPSGFARSSIFRLDSYLYVAELLQFYCHFHFQSFLVSVQLFWFPENILNPFWNFPEKNCDEL